MTVRGDDVQVHETAQISDRARIGAKKVVIGRNVRIGPHVDCVCSDHLVVGDNTIINGDTRILLRGLRLGEFNYLCDHLWFEGSLNARDQNLQIGDRNLICQNTRINCNRPVRIGSNVGIGQEVNIWTHGGFPDVLLGYPFNEGPVIIGNHVWLIARCVVLPGVTIGDHVVVGNDSLVNRDLPGGSFCAGVPVKVVREGVYPKRLTPEQKGAILERILEDWRLVASTKGVDPAVELVGNTRMVLRTPTGTVTFDAERMTVTGQMDEVAEDLRDFLRHRGVKFFTDRPFRSIMPPDFARWMREG